MPTQLKAKPFPGMIPYQQRAEKVLPILIHQAGARKLITYSQLAKEVGMNNPRNLNYVLGSIGATLIKLSDDEKFHIPAIQSIVVNKISEMPGVGGQWFIGGDKLVNSSQNLKKESLKTAFQEIFDYPYWDKVLKLLDLKPINFTLEYLNSGSKKAMRGKGGESINHKKLKEKIAKSSELIGLGGAFKLDQVECPLPSGDKLDISFRSKDTWIGVEVKSEISDTDDIKRGLFQCVKYESVMNAVCNVDKTFLNCKAILVIDQDLPQELIRLQDVMQIIVMEI